MPDLKDGAELIVKAFKKHAHKDGDKHTLTKGELKELLRNEFGEMLAITNDQAAVDRIFSALDQDQDNTVDFGEFMTITCMATSLYYIEQLAD